MWCIYLGIRKTASENAKEAFLTLNAKNDDKIREYVSRFNGQNQNYNKRFPIIIEL